MNTEIHLRTCDRLIYLGDFFSRAWKKAILCATQGKAVRQTRLMHRADTS